MSASIAVIPGEVDLSKGILVPYTLAILLSFLLSPVCDWLERWRLERIQAVLVTATVGFIILAVLIWTAVIQVSHLAPKIPEYRDNVEAKLNSVDEYALAALSKPRGFTKTGFPVDRAACDSAHTTRVNAILVADQSCSQRHRFGIERLSRCHSRSRADMHGTVHRR